jgi:hypothetical protein
MTVYSFTTFSEHGLASASLAVPLQPPRRSPAGDFFAPRSGAGDLGNQIRSQIELRDGGTKSNRDPARERRTYWDVCTD